MDRVVRVSTQYISKVKAFTPNARLYLVNVVVFGVAVGVFRLLLNFYILSLGYDEALLGKLVTTSSLTSLIAALPAGYVADLLGRKRSLIAGSMFSVLSIVGMVLFPNEVAFFAFHALLGAAQSLWAITSAPFLMENSGEKERTYLFSFSFGLQMLSGFIGNWIGGYMPSWVGSWLNMSNTSSQAYSLSIASIMVIGVLGIVPLLLLQRQRIEGEERSILDPLLYAARKPKQISSLVLPMLVTSIGAGLVMPFMNVFFRNVHHQPDAVIGRLFAWGSLAMGVGLLIAPPLAERYGKIRIVVITQALSVPFLILLGFAPYFWVATSAYYVRVALMNMSGPVYQTFVMEQVDTKARGMVASLISMAWNFGWAFSPSISGKLQVDYGFTPPFIGTIVLYIIAIVLYWWFFWPNRRVKNQQGQTTIIN